MLAQTGEKKQPSKSRRALILPMDIPSSQSQYAEAKRLWFWGLWVPNFLHHSKIPWKAREAATTEGFHSQAQLCEVCSKRLLLSRLQSHISTALDLSGTSKNCLLTEYYFIWLKAVTTATHAAWHLEKTAWERANVLKLLLLISNIEDSFWTTR